MKPKLRTVRVSPVLPKALEPLFELAYNIYWDWSPEISALFERIDPKLWEGSGRNPAMLLGQVDQGRLEALAADNGFLAHLRRASEALETYRSEARWFQRVHTHEPNLTVAYFSAEFGLSSCLPIYSGGLGLLAGDHLKSASDLGLPLVGVGLLYQEGYFRQYLNADGWQEETYPPNDFDNMPLHRQLGPSGQALTISVEFPGRQVLAQVWRIDVGRVPLFLLDTNVAGNNEHDRQITRALYSGGSELRIQQLMILGIGGFRALVAMGREPTVCHMNEGHAGFLGVERTRHLMQKRGIRYELARSIVDDGNIFTTHTPVPAGFDVFHRDLVQRYMGEFISRLGLNLDQFMALGRRERADHNEPFNMAVVAIRHAALRNGVSKLHGEVSRRLVSVGGAWVDWPESEVPIDSVTNGVHTRTWIAPEMGTLLERYLGASWRDEPANEKIWAAVDAIPDEELWRTHVQLRSQLVSFVRARLRWQLERRGATSRDLAQAADALDPDALTIGFARRFATYKRATLLFSDPDRLLKIVGAADRPVQFIFAGKAHPADSPAKEYIKRIVTKIKEPGFVRSIIFLEDYEISVAKNMVRGVDVWLNTPQRPREASGTSGMKLAPNGGINLSILDGWWAEGYSPDVGWAIGHGEDHDEARDAVEAKALYNLLETQVVPLFYQRNERGCPLAWVAMMKGSMKKLAARFSSDRMVMEYVDRFYLPTAVRYRHQDSGEIATAEALLAWKLKIQSGWHEVRVIDVVAPEGREAKLGQSFEIRSRVRLGPLAPEDVEAQVYHGLLDAKEQIHDAATVAMNLVGGADGVFEYTCRVPFKNSGRYGYTVRVIPKHSAVLIPNELTHIRWAE